MPSATPASCPSPKMATAATATTQMINAAIMTDQLQEPSRSSTYHEISGRLIVNRYTGCGTSFASVRNRPRAPKCVNMPHLNGGTNRLHRDGLDPGGSGNGRESCRASV